MMDTSIVKSIEDDGFLRKLKANWRFHVGAIGGRPYF